MVGGVVVFAFNDDVKKLTARVIKGKFCPPMDMVPLIGIANSEQMHDTAIILFKLQFKRSNSSCFVGVKYIKL